MDTRMWLLGVPQPRREGFPGDRALPAEPSPGALLSAAVQAQIPGMLGVIPSSAGVLDFIILREGH